MPILFPNLRVKVEVAPADVTEGGVAVLLCQAVTFTMPFPAPPAYSATTQCEGFVRFLSASCHLEHTLDYAGSLLDFESVQSRHCDRNRLLPFLAPGFQLSH